MTIHQFNFEILECNYLFILLLSPYIFWIRDKQNQRIASKANVLVITMNCFCGMVDQWKAFSLFSSRDHCQRSSPSQISDKPQARFQPVQNLSSGFVEWSSAVVITTTPWHHWFLAELFIYSFFIYKWLTANEITIYNKNSYVIVKWGKNRMNLTNLSIICYLLWPSLPYFLVLINWSLAFMNK